MAILAMRRPTPMYPLDLLDQLRPLVHNRILQDVIDGRPSRELAPCTGRAITGIRWLPPTGEVLLLFEAPEFADEPVGLTLPARDVTGLRVSRQYGLRVLLDLASHRIELALSDIEGREHRR